MTMPTTSVRRFILLSLLLTVASTVLLSGALFGFQLYRTASYAHRLELESLAQASLVAVADAAVSSDDRKDFVWSALSAQEPNLHGLMLLDPSGEVLFARGDVELLRPLVEKYAIGLDGFRSWDVKPTGDADKAGGRVTICALPARYAIPGLHAATLLMSWLGPDRAPVPAREAWYVFLALMGIGSTGGLLGTWLLTRHLLRPLRALSVAAARSLHEGHVGASLPIDRRDEIGSLARVIRELQGGLVASREATERLERSVERRVNAETHRIHLELQRAERKAWTDPLTGVGNRRLLDERLPQIFATQQQRGRDLAIVMFDIDYFKNLNDTRGHAVGDELLAFTGELLRQSVRGGDVAVRVGGDEFVLVLPSASAIDASTVAERTIRLFAQRARTLSVTPPPSMSAGVASVWTSRAQNAPDLLTAADAALYQAKERGKNRVAIFDAERAAAGVG